MEMSSWLFWLRDFKSYDYDSWYSDIFVQTVSLLSYRDNASIRDLQITQITF